jgi:ubiquinone/menaquinone biosynthesis C-methylase UbiE
VVSCKRYLFKEEIALDEVVEPGIKEMAVQNKIEKERLKHLVKVNKDTEKDFWSNYLQQYFVLVKSNDYREYLAFIESLLGGIKNGDIFLDAGCGNGHFSAWILNSTLKKIKEIGNNRFKFSYTGLDITEGAIQEAKVKIASLEEELLSEYKLSRNVQGINYSFSYVHHDLDDPLPFADNMFNKITCSLVLSYINKPLECIREFFRVLQPKGKIVVTSLKPYNDLSLIYKSFVDKASSEEELLEGRKLLSSAGRIKQKENFGYYKFYAKSLMNSAISFALRGAL